VTHLRIFPNWVVIRRTGPVFTVFPCHVEVREDPPGPLSPRVLLRFLVSGFLTAYPRGFLSRTAMTKSFLARRLPFFVSLAADADPWRRFL